jgi:hypothetical protein
LKVSIYIVELDRWGIRNDGTNAAATTAGMNNAFQWARTNHYQTVVLPSGTYLIDKNSQVNLLSSTHYKFYDCLFVKEPNPSPRYTVLLCDNVTNVTIEGATIQGDRERHDYSSGGTHEWGHGIDCRNSCYNIVIKHCEVFDCTGDGFTTTMDFSAIGGIQHPAHFAKGDINSQGSLDSTKFNYTSVTKFFDITGSLITSVGYFYYSGDGYGGYGTGSNLNKTVIKVHCYRADGTYLGYRNTRPYEFVYLSTLPAGTSQVRFSFLQNFDLMNGNLHYVSCARIPQHITYMHCKSHRNRRLGASVCGGRFITYDHCDIFNNSNPMTVSRGANPGYGIDVEDGYMANQKITVRHCNIYDNRAGAFICISPRGVTLENNKFRGNVTLDGSGDDYLSENNLYYGSVNGMSITSGKEADGTFCTFRNDTIFGEASFVTAGNTTFHNCVFMKSGVSVTGETLKMFACKFTFDDPDRDTPYSFGSKHIEIHDSLFDIRRCKGSAFIATYQSSEQVKLMNVRFITGEASGGNLTGTKNLLIRDCEFIHTGTTINYSRVMASETMRIENSLFRNLSFRIDGGDINSAEKLANDPGYTTHFFLNNRIIWEAPYSTFTHEGRSPGVSFLYIPSLEVSGNQAQVIAKQSSLGTLQVMRIFAERRLTFSSNTIATAAASGLNTSGVITIDGAYRKTGSAIPLPRTTIIAQNNQSSPSSIAYTNNVISQLETTILGNIPLPSFAAAAPVFGTYTQGQIIYSSNPVPGGYIGWVCVSAGTANGSPWTPNKSYAANAAVNANGRVYRATAGGTSGTIVPSHTSGASQDGTVIWEYVGPVAVFKPFGHIAT